MILFDSMMLSGLRWVLATVENAATAELDDDTALRETLLEAGLRHERGEISGDEFARIEESVVARLREIRELREAGAGPIELAATAPGTPGASLEVEAFVTGDFHAPRPRGKKAAKRRRPRLPSAP